MKNKILLALASLFIGMTTFAGTAAYADMTSGMSSQTPSRWCANDGGSAFERNCAGNVTEREGKAAYGEPREMKLEGTKTRSHFCSADSPTPLDPKC